MSFLLLATSHHHFQYQLVVNHHFRLELSPYTPSLIQFDYHESTDISRTVWPTKQIRIVVFNSAIIANCGVKGIENIQIHRKQNDLDEKERASCMILFNNRQPCFAKNFAILCYTFSAEASIYIIQ